MLFRSCENLTSITADPENEYYQSIDGNLYSKDGKTLIQYAIGKEATSFTIPDSVTTIGEDAFNDCDGLTSVSIGDSVTTIGDFAFVDCDGLTSVTIPDSVTTIGEDAFYECSNLTSVSIGNSVTTIGEYAFYDCDDLTSVTFANTEGWWVSWWSTATSGTNISAADLADAATAAKYLRWTYKKCYWYCS